MRHPGKVWLVKWSPDGRFLATTCTDGSARVWDARRGRLVAEPFSHPAEVRRAEFSPDGRRVAFHLASPRGYEIWTCDADGANRVRVIGHPDHLYFGTSWSPDSQWILYQDCQFKNDAGHDWSDICIGRPDGSEHERLVGFVSAERMRQALESLAPPAGRVDARG